MGVRMKVAFGCYLLLTISLAVLGVSFLLRTEFTSYHSIAVGMPWSEVSSQFQVLILALIKLAGGLWVALALSIFVLLLVPFREGARWSQFAIPAILVFQYVAIMPAMAHATLHTPATPPWIPTIGAIVVAVVAFAISVTGTKR